MLYEAEAQGYWSGNGTLWFTGINAYHPFFQEKTTPFIGGGLGYGLVTGGTRTTYDKDFYWSYDTSYTYTVARTEKGDGNGLILFIGGGYVLSRTSSVGLRAHLRYVISTFKLNDDKKTLP